MAIPNIVEGQIALDPINGIFYYIDSSGTVVSSTLNFLQASNSLITTTDGLSVDGNLVVSGNVVSVNTEILVVEDKNIELGTVASPSNTTADGGGITLKGSTDKTFVWSNATKSWTSSENIDLAAGKIFSINGVEVLSANSYSGSAAKWTNPRTITLSGDLSGNVSIDGSTNVTLTANIVANSVALGVDTTGDYVSSLVAGSGILISNNSGENTTPTISLNAGLSNLGDVTLSNIANGDFFRYNGSTWINDKIDLSTDTIGDYVDHLVAGTGVTISNNSGEASSPTIAIGQSVATNANVSFNQVNAELHGNVTGNLSGNVTGDLSGNVTGDLTGNSSGTHTGNVIGIASNALVWTNQRKITLDGDVTGNVFINGSTDVTINTTISANSVSLGTDTTGDYVANLVAGTGITITDNNGEGMTPVIKISNTYTTDMVANIANAEANAATYAQSLANTAYSNAVTYIGNVEIDDLSGVSISNAVVNDVLLYNGSTWINDDISITKLSDVNANNILNGQVLLWDSGLGKWVNSILPEQPQGSSISVTKGDGTSSNFTIFHGLGTADIVVVVKSNITHEVIETRWSTTNSLGAYSEDHVTVNFTTPPSEDEMQITVYGAVQSTAVVITGRLDNLSGDVMISAPFSGDMLVYNGSKWINRTINLSTDLDDVLISNISANQVLKFNGTNWVNSADQSGVSALNQLTDVSVNSAVSGDFLRYNGSAWISDPINLGTDTVGNYMSGISAGNGISVSHTPSEGSSATVSLNAGINDLADVVISNATNGEVLLWNGTNWINDALVSNPIENVIITSPEEFQSLVYDGTTWVNGYAPTVSYVRNAESNTLTIGTVVYLFGGTGDHATVKRADNDSDVTSAKTVGVVAANIAASQNGPVVTRGYVDGINLSMYSNGDTLYLGEDGGMTSTKPSAPEHLVYIGVVVRNTNNGIMYVAAQNGYELDELHNVALSNVSSGEFLKYDGSNWINDVIDLGTDTTGNYVGSVSAGTGITLSNTGIEGGTFTVTNAGVVSIAGTTDQIVVSASTGSITVSLPANVTISNDLTVTGDLTVNGNTTTLNTANLNVEDNFILLNSGVTASPSLNAGLEVERGTSTNVLVRWNETSDKWEVTNDGTTYGNIVSTADSGTVTSAMILDGTIVNADINASAAIEHSKLANATAGQVLLGTTTTGVVTATTVSGDVTITGAGVTAISSGVIVDADVSSSAAISLSKLASGTSGQIVVANTTGVPTYVNASGDVSVASNGAITINSNTVTNTQLQEGPARGGFNSQLNNATLSSNNYTLQTSDLAKLVVIDSTANATVTVGNILTTGDRIDILRANTGEVTFTAESGVVLNSTPGLKLRARWSSATIVKLAANSWVVIGDLKE